MAPGSRPNSPQMLRDRLVEFVPPFHKDWEEWEDGDLLDNADPLAFHRVMHAFTYSFGKAAGSLTQEQLRSLGNLVNAIVEIPDDLENAVSTCFLEHLHQVSALKPLWPYLSPKARAECHA